MGLNVSVTIENDPREGGGSITFARNRNNSVTISVPCGEDEEEHHIFVVTAEEAASLANHINPVELPVKRVRRVPGERD